MKSVLLTRSQENNKHIIKKLNSYRLTYERFRYIECPLLEYKNCQLGSDILEDYDNIIITSKYAANIIDSWDIPQRKGLWVVGNKSQSILQNSRFKICYVAKNVQDLINNLPNKLYQQTIYLSSNEITQDLPNIIKREIIYQVNYKEYIYEIDRLKTGIDYILLYSQNCASTLLRLLINNNLLSLLSNTTIIAISAKVADIVRPITKNIFYCDSNKPEQMLELLMCHAKSRK